MKCKPKSCLTDFHKGAITQKLYIMLTGKPSPFLDQSYSRKRKNDSLNKTRLSYLVTKYSSLANPIKRIIHSNCDPVLREVFSAPPKISFKRAPTLRDRLVPSHLPAKKQITWLHRQLKGTYKCGSCNHCSNIKEGKQFCDFKTNKMYNIKAFINCNTTFVVYRLSCKCGCFYVGRTKRRLKDRISEAQKCH